MYRLTVDNVETYIVVSRNVFSNHLSTHRKFDLKGSTVDREASEKEREKELPTLKDNDFVNEQMKVSAFCFTRCIRSRSSLLYFYYEIIFKIKVKIH